MPAWRLTRESWNRAVFVIILTAMVLTGCATPVGVRYLDSKEANRRLTESVLAGENLSAATMQMLNRSGLVEAYRDKPAEAIAALHPEMPTAGRPDRLFALAELSFLHASRKRRSILLPGGRCLRLRLSFPRGCQCRTVEVNVP